MSDLRTLVSAEELKQHIDDPEWRVFDVRHDLQNAAAGREAYATGHIPGARFMHLDDDLSSAKTGRNGRHPLPNANAFAQRLADEGIDDDTQIVVYDAQGGMYAARMWWMLRWLGHDKVALLDGGWQAWLAAGGAQQAETPEPSARGGFSRRPSLTGQVDVQQVLANLTSKQKLVIDARAPDRFRGENETIDPVGGHIPGAANRFFKDNLQTDGRFKDAATLREEWESVLRERAAVDVVAQCGSGVTACHNLLAMEIAGLSGAALYPGSWSEWCSDASRPVERG